MNVLLLNPPFKGRFSRSSRSPAVSKGGTLYYPIWLAYAAGVLEEAGFSVKLIDTPAEGLSLQDILHLLQDFSPDLIAVDTSTPSISSDMAAAEALKNAFTKSFVVLVGPHVSALPEESLALSPQIDAVARREYDYILRDLAWALQDRRSLESVQGLSFRQREKITHNPDRTFIQNLDDLPFVSKVYKKHLNIRKYYFAAAHHPLVMMISGRGCPYNCYFCLYPQTFHSRNYRMRSPENIVEELEWIADNLPFVKEVGIEDDTFTADFRRARIISELIIEKKIRKKWYCNVRPDVDLETLLLMKEAGCRLVTTGFESGSQAMLDTMHKHLKIEQIQQFAENARRAKILVHGCLVLGNPGENKESIQKSLDFVKKLNCDSMQFYPLFIYPGTEAFSQIREAGYLNTTDYSKWLTEKGGHNSVISMPGLSSEELLRICDKAYWDYHLRPAYLWMKLKQVFSHPAEGWRTIRSALHYFKSLF